MQHHSLSNSTRNYTLESLFAETKERYIIYFKTIKVDKVSRGSPIYTAQSAVILNDRRFLKFEILQANCFLALARE